MYPFVIVLEHITKSFLNLVGGHSYPKPITEEDIKEVVDLGLSEKALEQEEHKLVRNALEFDDKPIRNVMTPITAIFSLDSESKLSGVFSQIKKKEFSRIPIYTDNPENITGILHIWDIANLPEKEHKTTKLGKIARKPFFVFSSEKISDLLISLKKNASHMAIVTNEDDQIEGIITIEDLLEEIVGDIAGEVNR